MTPVILALDLASKIGWALGKPGARPKHGAHQLPSTGDEIGRFAHAFDLWLSDTLTMHKPERVVFEGSVMPGIGKTTPMTVRKLTGLTWHTELVCHRRDVICNEANVSTIKKFWAGSGNAKKPDMIAAARAHGFSVGRDDNQADALALWHYTCERLWPGQNAWMQLGRLGEGAHAIAP